MSTRVQQLELSKKDITQFERMQKKLQAKLVEVGGENILAQLEAEMVQDSGSDSSEGKVNDKKKKLKGLETCVNESDY